MASVSGLMFQMEFNRFQSRKSVQSAWNLSSKPIWFTDHFSVCTCSISLELKIVLTTLIVQFAAHLATTELLVYSTNTEFLRENERDG